MSGKILRDTFKAWRNKQPPSNDELIVTGEVEFTTGGWKAALVEAVPQGINDTVLILDEKETAPTGNVNQMVTKVPVRFQKTGAGTIRQVTIRGNGTEFTIDVQIVQ